MSAQRLPLSDLKDLDRAPGHNTKLLGLSYLMKRALLNPSSRGSSNVDNGKCDKKNEDRGTITVHDGAKDQARAP